MWGPYHALKKNSTQVSKHTQLPEDYKLLDGKPYPSFIQPKQISVRSADLNPQ